MNNINPKNKLFMAFASGKESTEGSIIKRYIGVAPVYILKVNPTKDELEELYEMEIENAPEYMSEIEVGPEDSRTKVPQVRVDFIVRTDPMRSNGIDITTKVSFYIAREARYNKDGSKVQVINKYGETAWLPIEDAKASRIPENFNWFEPADIRAAFIGEEELTNFIKTYLNIPNKSYRKKNGEVVELKNKSEAEARLDEIPNYFKGDFSELKNIIKLQPNNKIKCLFGIKTTDDNRLFQTIYNQRFFKNNATDYGKLEMEIKEKKDFGAYPTTEFEVCDLKEYVVKPTDFNNNTGNTEDIPFDPLEGNSPWFNM